MAEYTIQNNQIAVTIKRKGAEMSSLKKLAQAGQAEQEYMWCADPVFWGKSSPILFPFVGRVNDNEYRYLGTTYEMKTQHGFARDNEFDLVKETDTELWFSFSSNEETLKIYPFMFRLEIGYQLEGSSVKVIWKVMNQDSKTMYYSIGGHPAFVHPDHAVKREECYIDLHTQEKELISADIDTQTGLCKHTTSKIALEKGMLKAANEAFAGDAMIFEDHQTQSVSLCGPDQEAFLTVSFDAPLFGIWSPPGKNAPFICIEPWYGRCNFIDYAGELQDRKWGNALEAGQSREMSYTVMV